MEASQNEEAKALTDEANMSDQAGNDETGAGRFYECMFCKRGFSTAQALGGHMNIHRRDRARIRHQIPSTSNKQDDNDPPNLSYFSHSPNHPPYYPRVSDSLSNYHRYLPLPTSTTTSTSSRHLPAFLPESSPTQQPHPLSLFGHDLHMGPSTQPDRARAMEEPLKGQDGDDDGELDLELRLGHER
ncbi:hypothetical protein ACLOJK_015468 [Asimina triloba]